MHGKEAIFREFMKGLNLRGTGILFKSLPDQYADKILLKCRDDALQRERQANIAA